MTDWLDADEATAWRDVVVGATHLIARLEAQVWADAGLTHLDYGILVLLSEAPDGAVRMSVLAGEFGVDPSVITYRVNRLAGLELVERRRCSDDRRGVHAVITHEGRALLDEVAPAHVDAVRREFVDLLTGDELSTVGDVFARIRTHQRENIG